MLICDAIIYTTDCVNHIHHRLCECQTCVNTGNILVDILQGQLRGWRHAVRSEWPFIFIIIIIITVLQGLPPDTANKAQSRVGPVQNVNIKGVSTVGCPLGGHVYYYYYEFSV